MNRKGDMTPQMMVLGVLAMGPGTVADVQRRLVDLFPSADFSKNAAHGNLPRLAEHGYARLVETGAQSTHERYEVAEAGLGCVRDWVSSPPSVPAIREPVYGKVAFAMLEELPEVVRFVRAQQEFCEAASEKAHEQMQTEKRLQQKAPPRGWREELAAARRIMHLKHLKLSWIDIAARYKAYADEVEEMYVRFARKARLAGGER